MNFAYEPEKCSEVGEANFGGARSSQTEACINATDSKIVLGFSFGLVKRSFSSKASALMERSRIGQG